MASDSSTQTEDAPPPDPALGRLEPLLGEWEAEDHTHDSVLGPGVRATSTETFSGSPDGDVGGRGWVEPVVAG